ncbi:DUF6452 family protein [Sunxiuqinia elliptica]|uniref:Uncharacterized protein n=1 Tax=Sunxiuqinia elliptica TaxID=655355 RepID=A0A1I2JTY6_9BACT|nr:DUF6452 family protein [Sunxiuqinia elliptica]SFF57410.1 hypothetical protein SAMN05216283_109177 [Sunxiuqinia elliptica]
MMKKILFGLFWALALVACKEVFDPPPQALLQVKVKYVDEEATGSPKVSVYGVDMDDTIWIYQEITSDFRLPMSAKTETSFVILLDSIADTLTITHDKELIFESAESGFYNEYKILDVKHTFNRIEDYEVTDSAVTKNWHENIQLYINSLPADAN